MKQYRKTIYILVGPQGSGKTYWTTKVLLAQSNIRIVRISQDKQGKQHRRLFQECLKSGTSVVVDRMNFNFKQRNLFTHNAHELGYDVIIVWFDVDRATCLCRLAKRKGHPTVSLNADHNNMLDFYFSQFEPPSLDEYDEMFTIEDKCRCRMLNLQNRCYNKQVIVVGDIHGCFDEFLSLLGKCEYHVGNIVVATGDMVDRGPKIRETLTWFRDTPGAYSVEGNHENKFWRYLIGNPVKIANGLDRTIQQCDGLDKTSLSAWLQSLPNIIRLGNWDGHPVCVVHAGVDGRNPIEYQRAETCLYVRCLDGTTFFDTQDGVPWWETLDGSYTTLTGHSITKNAHPHPDAYCLDGGACLGGVLRAMVINNNEYRIVEVNCNDKS